MQYILATHETLFSLHNDSEHSVFTTRFPGTSSWNSCELESVLVGALSVTLYSVETSDFFILSIPRILNRAGQRVPQQLLNNDKLLKHKIGLRKWKCGVLEHLRQLSQHC